MTHDTFDLSADTETSFESLGISQKLLDSLVEIGYEVPTPIQARCIPPLLNGENLLGQAQTGTGKTGAFALPLLNNLDAKSSTTQVLVLTPTRELAIQVAEAFQSYARNLKHFHVLPIYGGQSMATQLNRLKRGPQVVVGTPGRVMDHLRRKTLKLGEVKAVVLDEADEMLNMGFVEDIEWILGHTPPDKQVALFSATMPPAIRKIASKYVKNPIEVKIESKNVVVDAIEQYYWMVSGLHKLDALTRVLEVREFDAAIVFVRTKTASVDLAEKLRARGHATAELNGDLSQSVRENTIQKLKKGKIDILVATDVAARGLDVERISHVINYDIPYDNEAYVHRIGRTGRAGRTGTAILFVSPRETRLLRSIEKATKQPLKPLELPSKIDVTKSRIERFKKRISEVLEREKLDYFATIVEEYAAEKGLSPNEVAPALLYLAQEGSPLDQKEIEVASEKPSRRTEGRSQNRGDKSPRRDRRDKREPEEGMVSYRIAVGRDHGVTPSNIVGAIANSAGIRGKDIGRIELYDAFSIVDLPEGMPQDTYEYLQTVQVNNQAMRIREADVSETAKSSKRGSGSKRFRRGSGKAGGRPRGAPGGGPRNGKRGGRRPSPKRAPR